MGFCAATLGIITTDHKTMAVTTNLLPPVFTKLLSPRPITSV
jgi:hypothetical protein